METEKAAAVAIVEGEEKSAIVLRGAVDIFFAADLRQAALALAAGDRDVEIACAELERLDTAVLQILLALKKELEQKGRSLSVVGLPAGPAHLAGLAGLTGHLL